MTINNPVHPNTDKVEPKVKAMTIASYLAGLLLVGVGQLLTDGTLLSFIPPGLSWISVLVTPIIPTIVAAIAGYQAKHQWRSNETNVRGNAPGTGGVNVP